MKKIIPIVLALLLILSACGNEKTDKAEENYEVILVTTSPEVTAEPDATPELVETPEATQSPEATPSPSPTPEAKLKVTKSPTGETLTEGMTTWFVARADNAQTITWEFMNEKGETKTMDEAKDLNKGLEFELYDDGETLELNNVPITMNGWSVRAKFTSGEETAYSDIARLTVNAVSDFYSAYESVFENYRSLATGGSDDYDLATDLDIAGTNLGYLIVDVDDDGVSELIIADINDPNGVVYSLFTLKNGKPVKVFKSYARDRYYFTGSDFVNQGSSGASDNDCYLCTYSKGEISVSKGVYSTAGESDEDVRLYYVTGGDRNTATEENRKTIDKNQFNATLESIEGEIIKELKLLPID